MRKIKILILPSKLDIGGAEKVAADISTLFYQASRFDR